LKLWIATVAGYSGLIQETHQGIYIARDIWSWGLGREM